MVIPYQTTKFNILTIAILDSTANLNSHQYFLLHGIIRFYTYFLYAYVP